MSCHTVHTYCLSQVYSLCSLSLHYTSPGLVSAGIGLAAVVVLLPRPRNETDSGDSDRVWESRLRLAYSALQISGGYSWRLVVLSEAWQPTTCRSGEDGQSTWYFFLFVCSAANLALAVVLGNMNYRPGRVSADHFGCRVRAQ